MEKVFYKHYEYFSRIAHIPAISVSYDKMAQDNVEADKKMQKSTCNMTLIAIIYKRISSYMKTIREMEGAILC